MSFLSKLFPKLNPTEDVPILRKDYEPPLGTALDFGFAEKETGDTVFGADGAGFVPNKFTPITADEASKAIATGYKRVTGSAPSKVILALLIAQAALETGNFKSIHNYNFGNVRGKSAKGLWTSFQAGEIIKGAEEIWEADSSDSSKNKFQAHETIDDGAEAYVRSLKSRPNWWNGLHTKTAQGFVEGLATPPAYFTANPNLYLSVLQQRQQMFLAYANKYGASGLAVVGTMLAAAGAGFLGVKGVNKNKEG